MTTLPLTCISGTEIARARHESPAGENLTILVSLVDANGSAVTTTGKTVVLGWDAPVGREPTRYEQAGGSTGVHSFTFSPSTTYALHRSSANLDVWLEESDGDRERLCDVQTVYFRLAVAPPGITVYYGVGVAGLTSVSTFTELLASSLDLSLEYAADEQKVYFAYPSTQEPPTLSIDGEELESSSVEIAVNGSSYMLVESDDLMDGEFVLDVS